jgi:diaminohydroxyphosphoribosylaminopyrimidine deaminase/5-amino-6-(5-phosphoribosylamino)uracil reductase
MPDVDFMQQALGLAARADLQADINPRVGALIIAADGTIVGQGWHQGSGTAHAEAMALAQAGERAQGATVYCTLEPCNAVGRMQPCTQALISAGVARVVYGATDPNPAKAGGAQTLREAGIEVTGGLLAELASALNPTWELMHERKRPWVIWKTATSLDGFIAAADGSSKWITSDAARNDVMRLRASVGAIVTGTGTVLADDPELTVRDRVVSKQPLRVVVGKREIPSTAAILRGPVPAEIHQGELSSALTDLASRGIHRVLLECGASLATSAWRAGAIDEVVWYQAPVVLGVGKHNLNDLGITALANASRFSFTSVDRIGPDLRISFRTQGES